MRENRLKQICTKNEKAIGTFLTLNAPLIAETTAQAGYDFFFVDMQHGVIAPQDVASILTAISTTDITPVVRVARNDSALIMQALDFGAFGIVCPMVNTRTQAEHFIEAMRYPPLGNRSFGPIRGAIYGGPDYAEKANSTLMAIAMIETKQALENLTEILETPGLDAVLVGPNDLSFSMTGQVSPNSPDPDVQEAFDYIASEAQGRGIIPGIHCTDSAMALNMFGRGFGFCSISSDQGLLKKAALASVAAARSTQ